MHIDPEMQKRFICCDVSWISDAPEEEEILFARSADIGVYASPQWKANVFKDEKPKKNISKM